MPCRRGGGTDGFSRLVSGGADSVFRVLDRRGGGRAGFAFPPSSSTGGGIASMGFSSSCSSFADLKEAGEDGSLLSNDIDSRLLKVAERLESCDLGRPWTEPGGPVMALVFRAASCMGFCLMGGDLIGGFCVWGRKDRDDSCVPSVICGRGISIEGFDFGTGGGEVVLVLTRRAPSVGSGGSVKLRRGLGDLTGGSEFLMTAGAAGGVVGVTGRFCSNILTKEFVGGIGVSSVGLSRGAALASSALAASALTACATG